MKIIYFLAAITSVLSLSAPAMAERSMPVSVVRSVRAPIAEEVNLTGDLQARRVSLLSAEVDGIVAKLFVDDGDRVSDQQIVLRLDDELSEIAQARASAEVDEAEQRHAEAQRRYSELTELAKQQHVPKTNVESSRAEIRFAEAALRQAQSDHRRAQALLKRHTVRAPFAGVVKRKLVEVGQWVETSSPLIELNMPFPIGAIMFLGRVNITFLSGSQVYCFSERVHLRLDFFASGVGPDLFDLFSGCPSAGYELNSGADAELSSAIHARYFVAIPPNL